MSPSRSWRHHHHPRNASGACANQPGRPAEAGQVAELHHHPILGLGPPAALPLRPGTVYLALAMIWVPPCALMAGWIIRDLWGVGVRQTSQPIRGELLDPRSPIALTRQCQIVSLTAACEQRVSFR